MMHGQTKLFGLPHPADAADAWLVCKQSVAFTVWPCYDGASIALGIGMTVERHTMAKDSNAVWSEIDVASLTAGQQKAYETYKDMSRQTATLRTAFEGLMNEATPEGKKLVFGYRFGKLSAALVDDDRKPVRATPAKQSLSEFLASQASQGKRA